MGNLELAYESVDMISEAGLTMTIYAAEPGSPTEHALALLASWTATQASTFRERVISDPRQFVADRRLGPQRRQLRLVWPQWQGGGTSSVREFASEFPFDVARPRQVMHLQQLLSGFPLISGRTAG